MAIIKAVNSKASIARGINYITQGEKTEEKLISGIDCNPKTAIDEMQATKELYDKTEGRQYAHYIQSFNPKDNDMLSLEKAHQIGKEWLGRNKKFNGHEVIMATHKDKDHIHNHFIINSVNFETGYKLHTNKKEYQNMKDISNQISKEKDLTVPKKSKEQGKVVSYSQNKYQAFKRHLEGDYKSYVLETALAVKDIQETASSKDDFIEKMQDKGYETNWKDTRKHITFINLETGKRVRLANLEKTFNDKSFTKGGMELEFQRNQIQRERETDQQTDKDREPERTYRPDKRDQGIKQPNAKLYNSQYGQRQHNTSNHLERNSSNREHQQENPGRDNFSIGKAKEHIRKSNAKVTRELSSISKPDSRTRTEQQKKARELERRNRAKYAERDRPSKSRDRELEQENDEKDRERTRPIKSRDREFEL